MISEEKGVWSMTNVLKICRILYRMLILVESEVTENIGKVDTLILLCQFVTTYT